MNKYIEFFLIYIITVVLIFYLTPYKDEELGLGIFISIILGLFFGSAAYIGYKSVIPEKKEK